MANLLSGATGVALSRDGTRAWWGCNDPSGRRRVTVMTVGVSDEPREAIGGDTDASCFLHGYPGRGWLVGPPGVLVPGHAMSPAGDIVLGEPCLAGALVVAIREQTADPRRSLIVADPVSGASKVLWQGSDFLGGLEAAPDGSALVMVGLG